MSETGYVREASIVAQNSGYHAAAMTVALINNGAVRDAAQAVETFNEIRAEVFNGALALAGAESIVEVLESAPNNRPNGPRGNRAGGSSAPRSASANNGNPGDI